MAGNTGESKIDFLGDKNKTIALVGIAVLIIFIFFYAQTQTQKISAEQATQALPEETVVPEQAAQPTPAEKQVTNYIYPSSNHFGIVNAKQDYSAITGIGVTWDRPYPGPFNWEKIGYDKYDWSAADKYVQDAQEHGLNTLAIVWPFNQVDQDKCYKTETEISFGELLKDLASRRRKPCDMDAYKTFVQAMVERYDADGVADMPGLKYGIKYWEITSEPDVQLSAQGKVYFQGQGSDYASTLKASYEAIKSVDANAKVLNGGVSMNGIGSTFWTDVFYAAKNHFDIAAYHCEDCDDGARIQEFKNFLKQNGVDKPVWVTSITFTGVSDKEQAQKFFSGYLNAFGKGADKVFYERWSESLGGRLALANIIQLPSTQKQVYNTFAALIKKLDNFSSAQEVSDGHYEFAVGKKTIHVFMKAMDLPKDVQGDVMRMDFNGTVKKEKTFNVASADLPAVIEKA